MSSDNKHSVKSKLQPVGKTGAIEAEKKERFGRKWNCFSCGARFYDMNKPEPLCPKCNADQRLSPTLKKAPSSRSKAKKAKAAAPPPAPRPKPAVKKVRALEGEEDIGVVVDEDAEDIAGDLEEELAEDLDGEGFEVAEGEAEEETPDED